MCDILTQNDIIRRRKSVNSQKLLKQYDNRKITKEEYLRKTERALHDSVMDDILYLFRAVITIVPLLLKAMFKFLKF